MNIFVINEEFKMCLGLLNIIPRKDEKIIFDTKGKTIECIVKDVVYRPKERSVLVFVNVIESYYSEIMKEIKW